MNHLYSFQLLMEMLSSDVEVNAKMNADAKRALVIRGMLRSMAARRIL